jgi:hypothetical protein
VRRREFLVRERDKWWGRFIERGRDRSEERVGERAPKKDE